MSNRSPYKDLSRDRGKSRTCTLFLFADRCDTTASYVLLTNAHCCLLWCPMYLMPSLLQNAHGGPRLLSFFVIHYASSRASSATRVSRKLRKNRLYTNHTAFQPSFVCLKERREVSMIGALLFRPDDDGGFQESSADMASTLFFAAELWPIALARFGEMFVLQSSMYSSSGTSAKKQEKAMRCQ